ncbi:NADH-quinone oxidoreductase subunit M [Cellulomonas carbonis]|uniref:NADH:ubiquinone oxidoreductase subunit M n=1 Tax=Cellulomonas carbonis T26 TaxID=947969 RepID=A0A0A0BW64_9CELL|nr:NADH-quinone oxidoreductase subunit M [Cellulomonas carbonis]KGM11404.1 NADH:ubiquinone oxidoreductase subunit M [Cellulomonas carbonis T26]GGC09464.1 NADH-quinone oxidoreductase subunit M [Cellulomonas carbonis]
MTDSTFPWLTAMVVLPVVGALAVWALPAGVRRHARHVGLAVSLLVLALGVGALLQFDTGAAATHQLADLVPWIPAFGVSWALAVDGVGLSLVLLSVVLVPLVLLAAWREHPDDAAGRPGPGTATAEAATVTSATTAPVVDGTRIRTYVALVLLLEAFMVAIFAARDVFLFYVLFEAMLIPVYFMIGMFGGLQRRYAAVKFLLFSLAGGLVMLVGVIALYLQGPGGEQGFLVDTLVGAEMSTWTERLIFLSFFLAFAIKAPMWPVHTWLPDAAEQAPAGTSALLVGVLDKVGTFGMLTLCLPLFPEASRWAAPVIIVLAVVSVLYGALLAIGQADLMRLIAYTSVSHFGFIVLGIFAFSSVSIQGASFYMVNHGLSTGALFLLAGFLVARRGSQRIADFGGLQKVVPVLAGTFLVAGLSALSLPGLSTFVSEFLVLVGTFTRHPAAAIVATTGVVLAALYVLLTYQRVFTGPTRPELVATRDLSTREKWVVGPLLAAMLVLGFYPAPALDLFREPAGQSLEDVGVQDSQPTVSTVSPAETGDHDGSDQ